MNFKKRMKHVLQKGENNEGHLWWLKLVNANQLSSSIRSRVQSNPNFLFSSNLCCFRFDLSSKELFKELMLAHTYSTNLIS